jgi:hypothetical protein
MGLVALSSVLFTSCDAPASNTPEATASTAPLVSQQHIDSIVDAVKKDATYSVTEAIVTNGILRIAVTNPDPDVVGHFNIHYDLHVVRVIYDPKDSIAMLANGITGIAVYTDRISKAQAYKDLIWGDIHP